MPTSVPAFASPLRRRLAVVVALGLATGAFAALVCFEVASAHGESVLPDRLARARAEASAPVRPVEAPPGSSTKQSVAAIADPRPVPVRHEATVDDTAATVLVPDFSGERVSTARRKAKALGLRLATRDEYGERVTSDFGYYRVRTQAVDAGTSVAPGTTIEIRARAIPTYAGGY